MTSGPFDERFDVQSMLVGYGNTVEKRIGPLLRRRRVIDERKSSCMSAHR